MIGRHLLVSLMVLVVGAVAAGCASEDNSSPDGVSVSLAIDRGVAQEVGEELTRANGSPAGPGGLMRGIEVIFSRRLPDGPWVADIEFADRATREDIERIEDRIAALGLDAVWLEDGDEWPFCEGRPDCPVVGERL